MSQDVMLRKRKVAAKTLVATGSLFGESVGEAFVKGGIVIHHADALSLYATWQTPIVIVSDGAYGLGAFEGDPYTPDSLADWYEPHVRAWSERATPQTTLWFWNSELGWANVHPCRRCFSAEINREFFELAVRRLQIGIIDDYVEEFEDVPLLGIKVSRWRRFFKEKNGD